MNDPHTVTPIHSAHSPPADAADDARYMEAPLNLILGFDLATYQIPLHELMPSKIVPDGVTATRKFKQIVSSIREIGLIEPLTVTREHLRCRRGRRI